MTSISNTPRSWNPVSLIRVFAVLAATLFFIAASGSVFAQTGGQGNGNPDVDVPTTNDPTTNAGGGTSIPDNSSPVDFDDSATLNIRTTEEDNRNQGFIGATAPGISENNFVGATSQNYGEFGENTLGETATYGGGVNSRSSSSIPTGGGNGGATGRGNQGGFGGTTTTSGNIIRRSIRSRLVQKFDAPSVPAAATINAFSSNLARQPGAQDLFGRYQVSISDKTATVTGTVSSQNDADRIVRQLRLQPGVYKIVNRLAVER